MRLKAHAEKIDLNVQSQAQKDFEAAMKATNPDKSLEEIVEETLKVRKENKEAEKKA